VKRGSGRFEMREHADVLIDTFAYGFAFQAAVATSE
jgi:hypothetical protein